VNVTPKPCPFCAETSVTVEEGTTFRWRIAVCNACGAQGPEVRHDTLAKDRVAAATESNYRAIKAWNVRFEIGATEHRRAEGGE
jgi:Lar family restriction alleviation protein